MKKFYFFTFTLFIAFTLLSWGVIGHRAIGKIAQNHLSAQAQAAVKEILGDQSLSDVSTYADEIRSKPEYKKTGSWHYINLPVGLTREQFNLRVNALTQDNVYTALMQCEQDLQSKLTSRDQKIFALKFIIHLVGDLHQPMHVSREEDKGGNSIQLNFNGQGSNLHRVWDSGLIEKQGLTYEQLAASIDKATPSEMKKWQAQPIIDWLYESYQASSQLYKEVDSMKSRSIGDSYYNEHITLVGDRIEKGGIRLAGVLNTIFSGKIINEGIVLKTTSFVLPQAIVADSTVTICDKVFSGKYFEKSDLTLLNMGAEYPDQTMSIVIKGADRNKFKIAPETAFANKTVCVTGKQILYKGKKEIIVTDTTQIIIKP